MGTTGEMPAAKRGSWQDVNHGVTEVPRPARSPDPLFCPPQPHTHIKEELLCWQNEGHRVLPHPHTVLWPPSPCPTTSSPAH